MKKRLLLVIGVSILFLINFMSSFVSAELIDCGGEKYDLENIAYCPLLSESYCLKRIDLSDPIYDDFPEGEDLETQENWVRSLNCDSPWYPGFVNIQLTPHLDASFHTETFNLEGRIHEEDYTGRAFYVVIRGTLYGKRPRVQRNIDYGEVAYKVITSTVEVGENLAKATVTSIGKVFSKSSESDLALAAEATLNKCMDILNSGVEITNATAKFCGAVLASAADGTYKTCRYALVSAPGDVYKTAKFCGGALVSVGNATYNECTDLLVWAVNGTYNVCTDAVVLTGKGIVKGGSYIYIGGKYFVEGMSGKHPDNFFDGASGWVTYPTALIKYIGKLLGKGTLALGEVTRINKVLAKLREVDEKEGCSVKDIPENVDENTLIEDIVPALDAAIASVKCSSCKARFEFVTEGVDYSFEAVTLNKFNKSNYQEFKFKRIDDITDLLLYWDLELIIPIDNSTITIAEGEGYGFDGEVGDITFEYNCTLDDLPIVCTLVDPIFVGGVLINGIITEAFRLGGSIPIDCSVENCIVNPGTYTIPTEENDGSITSAIGVNPYSPDILDPGLYVGTLVLNTYTDEERTQNKYADEIPVSVNIVPPYLGPVKFRCSGARLDEDATAGEKEYYASQRVTGLQTLPEDLYHKVLEVNRLTYVKPGHFDLSYIFDVEEPYWKLCAGDQVKPTTRCKTVSSSTDEEGYPSGSNVIFIESKPFEGSDAYDWPSEVSCEWGRDI